jgi:three-Cys-motif partner protein
LPIHQIGKSYPAKKHSSKIAYIDLFSGPGRYEDGTNSTPLLILEKAIADSDMSQMLVTIFNDVNQNHSHSLETAIKSLPGISSLKYAPQVFNGEVGKEIVKMFEQMHLVPALFFIDPWGYKGLTLRLVNSVLKDWGCDCIFFFNYNRINMGLSNQLVVSHLNSLFGKQRADSLRLRIKTFDPIEREHAIVEELSKALQEMGGKFVLPFCFKNEKGTRSSHYLIFVSKHFKGYELMKQVMSSESSNVNQGVSSFEYCSAAERHPLLFQLSRPLDDLEEILLIEFAGQCVTMEQVYHYHNVGTPFIRKNYKQALINLEAKGEIGTNPQAAKRPKRKGETTFADSVIVTFPPRSQ